MAWQSLQFLHSNKILSAWDVQSKGHHRPSLYFMCSIYTLQCIRPLIKKLVLFVSCQVWTWTLKKEKSCSPQPVEQPAFQNLQVRTADRPDGLLGTSVKPTTNKLKIRYVGNTAQHSNSNTKPTDVLQYSLRSDDRNRCQHVDTITGITEPPMRVTQAGGSELVNIFL